MNRFALFILVQSLIAPALHAIDAPPQPARLTTGTPRSFTETERAKVDKYLYELHEETATSFASQMGFGLDRMEPLILFHWFTDDLKTHYDVELLGKLKEDAPVVYKNPLPTAKGENQLRNESAAIVKATITLPTAEQFKNAPSRALLPIEEAALKLLKKGTPLYWEQTGEDVRMVGALSAKTDCAKCHKSPEGELLGALTYRFETTRLLKRIKEIDAFEAEQKLKKDAAQTQK